LKRQEDLHSEVSYKRLERGSFIWPAAVNGVVPISSAQLSYMLSGIDWRNPVYTFRPALAG
jgi:transposase